MRGPPSPRFEDVLLFARVAEEIDQPDPPSMAKLARQLGQRLTPYKIQASIRRLEQALGGISLLHTAEKMASATSLTAYGRRYAEEIGRLLTWRPDSPPILRLSVSHSLLTSNFLTVALAKFQKEHNCLINLNAHVSINFDRIVSDLQRNQLDAVVLYSSAERLKEYPGVERHTFPKKFEVVLIGTDSDAVTAHHQDKSLLANKRVVILPPDNQPNLDWLPKPDRAAGGERLIMETIDSLIACVRARVADFGLVAAHYYFLDPLRSIRQLFFSDPIGDPVHLLGLAGQRSTPLAMTFIKFLDKTIAAMPNEKISTRPCPSAFSPPPDWFKKLQWAYYIDYPRGRERATGEIAPMWKWQQVLVNFDKSQPNYDVDKAPPRNPLTATFRFHGFAQNLFNDKFQLRATYIENSMFVIEAHRINRLSDASVPAFVSVFTLYEKNDGGYIYGHWSGTDPITHQPAIFSTIWSVNKLSLIELRQIAQHMGTRTLIEVDEGYHDFKGHPDQSTLRREDFQ